jgi:hypothetical protein
MAEHQVVSGYCYPSPQPLTRPRVAHISGNSGESRPRTEVQGPSVMVLTTISWHALQCELTPAARTRKIHPNSCSAAHKPTEELEKISANSAKLKSGNRKFGKNRTVCQSPADRPRILRLGIQLHRSPASPETRTAGQSIPILIHKSGSPYSPRQI